MENNIEKQLIEKIKSGDIKMKSRAYFVGRLVLLGLFLVSLFLFIIYLASFTIFSLRTSGAWFLPEFGFAGLRILLGSFPWVLVLLSAVLIFLLEFFAEHFAFVYRRPMMVSLCGVIVAVLIGSFLVGATPLHAMLFASAQDSRLPVLGDFYNRYGAPPIKNLYHGLVSELDEDGFKIKTPTEKTFSVLANQKDFPSLKNIKEGDAMIIMGELQEHQIRARIMKKIKEDRRIFKSHKKGSLMK